MPLWASQTLLDLPMLTHKIWFRCICKRGMPHLIGCMKLGALPLQGLCGTPAGSIIHLIVAPIDTKASLKTNMQDLCNTSMKR